MDIKHGYKNNKLMFLPNPLKPFGLRLKTCETVSWMLYKTMMIDM